MDPSFLIEFRGDGNMIDDGGGLSKSFVICKSSSDTTDNDENCKISSHSFICSGVKIEDNVFIGHNVTFINDRNPKSTNNNGDLKKDDDWILEKTLIEEGASIGSGSVIMCGIKIGRDATVGAGSLVLKSIPRNGITIVSDISENIMLKILHKILRITYVKYGLIYFRIRIKEYILQI